MVRATRQEMVAALTAAGVRFARNASVSTLQPPFDQLNARNAEEANAAANEVQQNANAAVNEVQ